MVQRAQRRDLLAGLLDTDGTVDPTGCVQFPYKPSGWPRTSASWSLSLGYRCGWSTKRVAGRSEESSIAYTLTFTTDDEVFGLERKRLVHKERGADRSTARRRRGSSSTSSRIESVPVRCIEVEHEDAPVPGRARR